MSDQWSPGLRLSRVRARSARLEAPARDGPVSDVLARRLNDLGLALFEAETGIRQDDTEAVHDTRVACRRLSALLATFRPAFRAEVSDPLRADLRWLAQTLGGARDGSVVRERLIALAEHEDDPEGLLEQLRRARWGDVDAGGPTPLEVVDSDRCAVVMDALGRFVTDPPWSDAADRQAGPFTRSRVRKDWRRLEGRVSALSEVEDDGGTDERLHEVRKAAKRTRYALEVAELLWPRKAGRLRTATHRLTDVLGDRQDAVVTRAALRRLAEAAHEDGPSALALGRLDRIEEVRAEELLAAFGLAWTEAERRRQAWP